MALGKCSNYYDCMQFTPKLSGLKQGWYLFFFMSLPFGVSSTELVYLGPIWCQVRWLEARGLELSEGFLTCLVIDVVSWDLSLGCQLGQLKSQLTTSMTSHVAWAPPWHRGCVPRVNISKEVSQVEAVFSLWPSPGSHVALLLPCWRTQSQLPNRLKGRKRGSQFSVERVLVRLEEELLVWSTLGKKSLPQKINTTTNFFLFWVQCLLIHSKSTQYEVILTL